MSSEIAAFEAEIKEYKLRVRTHTGVVIDVTGTDLRVTVRNSSAWSASRSRECRASGIKD